MVTAAAIQVKPRPGPAFRPRPAPLQLHGVAFRAGRVRRRSRAAGGTATAPRRGRRSAVRGRRAARHGCAAGPPAPCGRTAPPAGTAGPCAAPAAAPPAAPAGLAGPVRQVDQAGAGAQLHPARRVRAPLLRAPPHPAVERLPRAPAARRGRCPAPQAAVARSCPPSRRSATARVARTMPMPPPRRPGGRAIIATIRWEKRKSAAEGATPVIAQARYHRCNNTLERSARLPGSGRRRRGTKQPHASKLSGRRTEGRETTGTPAIRRLRAGAAGRAAPSLRSGSRHAPEPSFPA